MFASNDNLPPGADIVIDEHSSGGGSSLPPGVIFRNPDQYSPAAEPANYRLVEIQLRKALAKSEALLLEKDELIHRQELLKEESDHRLLNDLQMTISLLFGVVSNPQTGCERRPRYFLSHTELARSSSRACEIRTTSPPAPTSSQRQS